MVGRKEGPPRRTLSIEPAVVNGALFEMLDLNDTHIPTYLHATSAVLPVVLAVAAEGAHGGRELLTVLRSGSRRSSRARQA